MSIAIISLQQIIIMFILILLGFLCYKIKLVDKDTNKKLSDIVLVLANPCVIFISYQRDFDVTLLKGLLISFLLAVVTHVFGLLISRLVLRSKRHEGNIAIERFALIYSNCGFMGIPLVNGLFGSEGVFYLTAYMTIFNIFVWTQGIIMVSGKSDRKSIIDALISPSIISIVAGFIFFVCKINLPDVMKEAIFHVGNMNTPLAMIVAGVTIAQTDIVKLLTKVRIYYIAFIKLLLIPATMLLLFGLFDIPRTILLTSVLAAACPTAATINLFSIKFNKNYLYASELFAISTLLSLFSIPFIMLIANILI